MRGRPPITRARVLGYWSKHGPCSIMQIVRATGADRPHIYRIFKAAGICPVGRQGEVKRVITAQDCLNHAYAA